MASVAATIPAAAFGEAPAIYEDCNVMSPVEACASLFCGAALDADQPAASSATTASDMAEEVQLPTLMPLLDACQSDNEAEEEPGHLRKARRVSCSEPPPGMAEARNLPDELLTALEAHDVMFLHGEGAVAVEAYAHAIIARDEVEDNFYVYDLAVVERLLAGWRTAMPRVHPCYAVKCNPNDGILTTLAALGAGFDCASQAEMAQVLALGVSPDRIVYAHPQKPPRELRWAAVNGIGLTTVDTQSELEKVAQLHPTCGLLLRIRADDPNARCQLGNKYGAEPADVPHLLATAARLGLAVRGVSFHVGSGATNPAAFTAAIAAARAAFDLGATLGFTMDTLDIGGGFSGGKLIPGGGADLGGVPAAVNAALEEHFPLESDVRVIAEPGRYFAEACATMACCITGWRERPATVPGAPASRDYWLTDGLYGSMNCMLYDHAILEPTTLRSPLLPPASEDEEEARHPTTLFGPTCDGLDTICRDVPMPRLRNGDFVLFPRFGAYTIAGAVNFNGFDVAGAAVHYVWTAL